MSIYDMMKEFLKDRKPIELLMHRQIAPMIGRPLSSEECPIVFIDHLSVLSPEKEAHESTEDHQNSK